jgi:hypothetical protein
MHTCQGDDLTPTHECWCEIGRGHTAREHRSAMRERDRKPHDSQEER